jgi:DNA polymerase III delta subunit
MTKKISQNQESQAFIFLGEDDFSLRRRIDHWKREFAKKHSSDGIITVDGGELGEEDLSLRLESVSLPTLFSQKKLIIAKDCLPTKAQQEKLSRAVLKLLENIDKDCYIIFYNAKKLDRRLSSIKNILKAKVSIVEFALPHGKDLNAWLRAYAETQNAVLDELAAEALAERLGRDLFEEKRFGGKVVERKEAFDLWQASSELAKLASFSPNITKEAVQSLVMPKLAHNIFELTDAVFKKDLKASLNIVENLFKDQTLDDKAAAIKITGLLAEQARSLLLIILLKEKKLSNQEIAEQIAFSPGRVFMLAKMSERVGVNFLKRVLFGLREIDLALKTSDQNPKLLIERFLSETAVMTEKAKT